MKKIKEKRQWLYNQNAEPTIFTGQSAIDDAIEDGWEDTPTKFEATVIEATVIATVDDMKKDELLALAVREEITVGSKITVPELKELLKDVIL